ncbi:MAG: hypothetical protein PHI40_06935 [Caldisericia bacterium]|nr:hypothetical protein [Caldisericia bacterium]
MKKEVIAIQESRENKENKKMEKYRIEEIRKATVNRRQVKLFKAYEYDEKAKAYVFKGQYAAPQRTANKNLVNFID